MSLVRIRLPIILTALLATVAFPPALQAMDDREFKRQFTATQNSWERRALITRLDPTDSNSLDLLLKFVLKTQEWYYREAAIDVLAGVYDPDVIRTLERLRDRDPVIAEGIALAFGRSKNRERVPHIISLLESRNWVVRRAGAIALRHVPDKQAIEPLIKVWENEDRFVVWIHILESLEAITRQRNMSTARDWRDWWNVVKDTFELPSGEEDELSEDEKSGDLVTTRVRGTNLTSRLRGSGLPLLVLPDYGYEQDYLETYMRVLENDNRIIYMRLPGAADFVDPPLQNAPNLPNPYYPLERIVEAFEELQKQLEKDGMIEGNFAIMAHGLSTWIAMTYAANHPRSVRRMILIAASSGDKAAGEGIERLVRTGQQTGDLELEHYGQSRQWEGGTPKYSATSDEERTALGRKGFTVRYADRRDLEIGRIYGPVVRKEAGPGQVAMMPQYARPMGSVFIPEFSLFRLARVPTPTLVIVGQHSVETSRDDANAIARHYGRNASVLVFPRSGEMPFIEENDRFVETVRRFLGGGRRR